MHIYIYIYIYPTALRAIPATVPFSNGGHSRFCVPFPLKNQSQMYRNEHQKWRAIVGNMYNKSMKSRTRRHPNDRKSWFWVVLGLWGAGLGAQGAPRPTQMHFRVQKPRSWLTVLVRFSVQFAWFFEFILVVFSRRYPERCFTDFGTILCTLFETFGEVFGEGWRQ